MKKQFLRKIALSNTHSSSFQHARVYTKDVADSDREKFQKRFREKLAKLEQAYKNRVSEDEHIQNIQAFADQLSREFPQVLVNGRMRTGVAQKAVNLYLKFLWCLGLIQEPPHCPIDGIVLIEVGDSSNWTELDGVDSYREIINKIKAVAGEQSLSEWELHLWNREAQGLDPLDL